jgi:hypothetical protein
MSLIEDVARLKELAGRRLAIIERANDTGTPNHAILERIEIEQEMLDTGPALLEVLGAFQDGDAERLGFVMSGEYRERNCDCEQCQEATDMLHHLAAAAAKMEAKQE